MLDVARLVLATAAIAAISAGCWMIAHPLGLIAGGAIVLAGCVYGAVRAR